MFLSKNKLRRIICYSINVLNLLMAKGVWKKYKYKGRIFLYTRDKKAAADLFKWLRSMVPSK